MTIITFPSIRIIALSENNLPEAALFLHRQWHELYGRVLPRQIVDYQSVDTFSKYLKSRLGFGWLSMHGAQVRGLLTVSSNCVEDLYVDAGYRRRRIATGLVERAMEYFCQRGFQQAQVGCEDFNRQAIDFFEANDWFCIGGEPVDVPGRSPVHAMVYSVDVTPKSMAV